MRTYAIIRFAVARKSFGAMATIKIPFAFASGALVTNGIVGIFARIGDRLTTAVCRIGDHPLTRLILAFAMVTAVSIDTRSSFDTTSTQLLALVQI